MAEIKPELDEIVQEIDIAAPRERVFRALTDPEQIKAWWGSDDTYRITVWGMDLRVGGLWRSEGLNAAGQPFHVEGRYLEVDPPRALSFTWKASWRDMPTTTVRILLESRGRVTHVIWKHSGFAGDQGSLKDHRGGLPSVLGWLKLHAEKEHGKGEVR